MTLNNTKQTWFRYAKGEKGNRTVCWSERPHKRDVVFSVDNSRVSKHTSPSLAKTLEKSHKVVSESVISQPVTKAPLTVTKMPPTVEDET